MISLLPVAWGGFWSLAGIPCDPCEILGDYQNKSSLCAV